MVETTRDPYASERDFYRRLLDLGGKQELEPLLDEALALIVDVTSAITAYVELYDDNSTAPRFWRGYRLSDQDLAKIRTSISRGIIGRAVTEGRTIETPSASMDDRFSDLGSVRQHAIQAVLCAPVGVDPPIGVIYLQGRTRPGMFTAHDRECVELFARQLAPLTDRLVRRSSEVVVDHTREARERIIVPQIIGRSRALARLLQDAASVAHLNVDVLITGPSGTGKSMLAHAIANNSPRRGGPFVELNSASLQDSLFENEMFGAERGAHSTATRRATGHVAAAEGGTLFLDEVADLTMVGQAKLLKLLETRAYHPLGSSSPIRADFRFMSATNANLKQRVAQGRFREDLYYRLHIMPLEVPALDTRRDDIPDLVEHFVAVACTKHELTLFAISRRALAACQNAQWPGHTRQLRNEIEAAVIRANGEKSTTVHAHHIFPALPTATADAALPPRTLQERTREFQRTVVCEALEANDWHVSKTAAQLELARSHLYNLINDFQLHRAAGKNAADKQGGKE